MIARDKFHVGQRVKLSAKGLKVLGGMMGSQERAEQLRGHVTAFNRTSPGAVYIEHEGDDKSEGYHMDFWEGAEDGQPTS